MSLEHSSTKICTRNPSSMSHYTSHSGFGREEKIRRTKEVRTRFIWTDHKIYWTWDCPLYLQPLHTDCCSSKFYHYVGTKFCLHARECHSKMFSVLLCVWLLHATKLGTWNLWISNEVTGFHALVLVACLFVWQLVLLPFFACDQKPIKCHSPQL